MTKILVIDDVPEICELVKASLEGEGFQVEDAHNGREGLEKARLIKPALIFLDIMMPDMSGLEVCRELRKDPSTAKIPVVILSVRSSDEDIRRGFKSGADEYITKPFNPLKLGEMLRKRIAKTPV